MNIPAGDFENFLKAVEDISKFTNINLNANDVTKYVLDIDSRLKSLNAEKEALEEIKAMIEAMDHKKKKEEMKEEVIEEKEELSAVVDETTESFANKAKDFLGLDNIDLPDFAIKAAINQAVG